MSNMQHRSGRHFLQVPGPTPIPERILAAMNRQVIDHRSPQFQSLAHGALTGIRTIFKTKCPVLIFPSSGTGAWEAALLNTLSPGDHILTVETGQFALLWSNMARDLGLVPHVIDTDWRIGPEPNRIEERLRQDKDRLIKAVCVVHNETSTGARAWIEEIRAAIDEARHPALLMVDTVSSLAVMDFRHDEWGVDVAISGSQKGMMLPPGLSFTAVSERAIAVSKTAGFPRSYWQWQKMLAMNADGFFPYTPATGLLFGLAESISMLHAEGLENVFARHDRLSEAVRRAVEAWDLEVWCRHPKYYSSAVTAVAMPEGHDAEGFRKLVRERFDVSLAMGLNKLLGKVFRIGHLGDTNDVTIIGALAAVEMALEVTRVPHNEGGVTAAMRFLRR